MTNTGCVGFVRHTRSHCELGLNRELCTLGHRDADLHSAGLSGFPVAANTGEFMSSVPSSSAAFLV